METLDVKTTMEKERQEEALVAHNTRMGVVLFLVYVVFYGGFMALSAFAHERMSEPFLGGVNLAVVYGFSLILVALVLALVYMKVCRKPSS
jgi:uncharacterized membrane protein (DUF485 family)